MVRRAECLASTFQASTFLALKIHPLLGQFLDKLFHVRGSWNGLIFLGRFISPAKNYKKVENGRLIFSSSQNINLNTDHSMVTKTLVNILKLLQIGFKDSAKDGWEAAGVPLLGGAALPRVPAPGGGVPGPRMSG
jgi:hypothetical protein